MLHGELDWLQGFILTQPKLTTVDLRTNGFDVNPLRALFPSFTQWQSAPVSSDVMRPIRHKLFVGAFEALICLSGSDECEVQFFHLNHPW